MFIRQSHAGSRRLVFRESNRHPDGEPNPIADPDLKRQPQAHPQALFNVSTKNHVDPDKNIRTKNGKWRELRVSFVG